MRFAQPWWLLGTAASLVVAAMLIAGGFALVRAMGRFGDADRIKALTSMSAANRRTVKGVLLVFATALAFVAMAQPQYGHGTRVVPATNLDVVIVLDFSKSMYARDVPPSRIAQAKAEVARLIKELPGARFAAVAFAGDPIGFPLTSDGMAVAQFFRQLQPNDMPVGGTSIGRALNHANELLGRDPKAAEHRRVIVLITDGEDLAGNPVSVAQTIGASGTTIHVVQIGGQAPEVIPEVDPSGAVVGIRRGSQGEPLTTSLSADGEKQLESIAQAASGTVIRAQRGSTGIDVLTRRLAHMMESELSEKVDVLYADIYYYPLGFALLLLLIETFLGQTKRHRDAAKEAKETKETGKPRGGAKRGLRKVDSPSAPGVVPPIKDRLADG